MKDVGDIITLIASSLTFLLTLFRLYLILFCENRKNAKGSTNVLDLFIILAVSTVSIIATIRLLMTA